MPGSPKNKSPDTCANRQAEPVKRVHSEELLEGRDCLMIEHNRADYVLRHTSKGRLILTKI